MVCIDGIIQDGINLINKDLKTQNKSFFYYHEEQSFYSYNEKISYILNSDDNDIFVVILPKTAVYGHFFSRTTSKHIRYIIDYCKRNNIKYEILGYNEKIELKEFQNSDKEVECPITLKNYSLGSETKCGHKFSKEGLNKWIKMKKFTCPICRQIIK